MHEEFDAFLSRGLAPPERAPDRDFVARVDARIRLEARLEAARSGLVRRLGLEMLALAAIAAGLLALARAPALRSLGEEEAAPLMAALILGFALVVLVLGGARAAMPGRGGRR